MPLYEFECEACRKRFERIQKFSDPTPEVCPNCGKGPVRKLPSSPAIQFKGSGFYITDYAKKSSPEAGSKSGSGTTESSSASSGESKSADTKATDTSKKPDKKD
ncbi:MAG TPA: zinc ribbon domain-containing protein [Vicinamibacterales bacterium]|jgi:putative FmdB family regulatory protein|nr:zinc ribbon domain-containing protein [Vicinamibacterales bacterium]